VTDADTFFRVELPALQAWTFSAERAARITQPVLAVRGADTAPLFAEGHQLIQQWWPQAEPFVLPAAAHPLQMTHPQGMAAGLAGFFARYPLAVRA
jgi:pimeloyl-ACP methyl ester carboxylesterase